MKELLFGLFLIMVVLFNDCSYAKAENQQEKPNVPFIQNDICPFECCRYGKWIAKSGMKAYKKEGDSSTIAFTIKPGEQFTAVSGNIHTVTLGVVIITESFDAFKKGDNVFVLSYKGEGFYDVWHKGENS